MVKDVQESLRARGKALEEAFRREEHIRTSTQRARENIARLHNNFNRVGKAYVRQLEHLRKIQSRQIGRAHV